MNVVPYFFFCTEICLLRKPISTMFKIKITSSYLVTTRQLSRNYDKDLVNKRKDLVITRKDLVITRKDLVITRKIL